MLSKSCKLTCFYFTLLFSSIHPAIANETPSTPIVIYNFKVQQALSQADGRTKEAWLYNNQLPGPVIKVPKGTKLNIHVQNHLKVPTSIHWHGMYQLGTWTMDGVTGVSRSPIPPGQNFTYEFTAEPAGTHWYHSHTGVQYSEGLFGALIIEDPTDKERWQYDSEELLIFNDWFQKPSEQILEEIKNPKLTQKSSDKPDIGDYPFESLLINGKGSYTKDIKQSYARFKVKEGSVTRFRLINASSTYAFNVQFDGHPVTVIAADGQPIQPIEVDYLPMAIGERYDILLTAKNKGTHWIQLTNLAGQGGKAILQYDDEEVAPSGNPLPLGKKKLTPELLVSTEPTNLQTLNVKEIPLVLGGTMNPYEWTINGKAFPDIPPIEVRKGEHIRFIIENPTNMDHPFHLHGHSFWALGSKENMNLINPPRRDQVNIPAKGNSVIQWTANNPGKWFFHCHIEWHLATGMGIVIQYIENPG